MSDSQLLCGQAKRTFRRHTESQIQSTLEVSEAETFRPERMIPDITSFESMEDSSYVVINLNAESLRHTYRPKSDKYHH